MNFRELTLALKRISRLPFNGHLMPYLLNKIQQFYFRIGASDRVAYPSTIMLELTNHCNLACTMCPREHRFGREMDKGEMDPEKAKKILDEVLPYVDSIGLTGLGETFLYKHLAELVDYIRSRNTGVVLTLSTNAAFAGFIEKAAPVIGKVDTIQVSVDGLDSVYESIRRNASFELFDANLQALSKMCGGSSTAIVINMVVMKENYHQMSAMVDYARRRNVAYCTFTPYSLASTTDDDAGYYRFFSSRELLDTERELEHAIRNEKQVAVTKCSIQAHRAFRKCFYPWSHFYITWNGFVSPCCAKPFPKELHFGNVAEADLITTLNSDTFRRFRREWNAHKVPAFCERCRGYELLERK